MTQSWYHVVVIGTELAGLVYAALAARQGYRVLVIGHGERQNTYKFGNYWFLRAPERIFGFEHSPAAMGALGALSLGLEMKNRPLAVEPALQLAMPGVRLDVSGSRRWWERDVAREFPEGMAGLDALERIQADRAPAANALLQRLAGMVPGQVSRFIGQNGVDAQDFLTLPPRGHRERSELRGLCAALGAGDLHGERLTLDDPHLAALIGAPLMHLSGVPVTEGALTRLWPQVRAGVQRFPGGLDGLKRVFLRKLTDLASDFRPEARAHHLKLRRGRVHAVALSARGEAVGCELLVVNTSPEILTDLINLEDRSGAWHAALGAREVKAWRFVMNLGVDPEVLPRALGPELVWVRDGRMELTEDNNLWLSQPGLGGTGTSEGRPGPGVLQVTMMQSGRFGLPTAASLMRTAKGARDALAGVIPWLDEHIRAVDLPALRTVRREGEPDSVTLVPQALTPIYAEAHPETLGWSALSPETPYPNVLLSGDALFSGLGTEGAFVSALQTLNRTEGLVKLKRSLRSLLG